MSYFITFIAFWFGYLLGRMDQIINLLKKKHHKEEDEDFEKPKSFLQQIKEEEVRKSTNSIDERKFVTKVDTSFQKNFVKIGKETVAEDNINSSISKLAKLKNK